MDPFEEFEFKPLTEGLGFHKKAEVPQAGTATPSASTAKRTAAAQPSIAEESGRQKSQSISDLIAALPPSLDLFENEPEQAAPIATSAGTPAKTTSTDYKKSLFGETATQAAKPAAKDTDSRPQIFQPLGRKDYAQQPATPKVAMASAMPAAATETPIKNKSGSMVPPSPTLKSPLSGTSGTVDYSRSFPHLDRKPYTAPVKEKAPAAAAAQPAPRRVTQPFGLKKIATSFSAAILDAMVITGFATIFLVSILLITEVDLVALLSNSRTDISTFMNLGLLYFIVMQLYMLSARGVFGATLGEWAFDMQLGTIDEQRQPAYYGKIMWRQLLMIVTGFVSIPVLSKIFRRDLAAGMGAPQLYVRG